ncbi:MAG: crossover junction endodeoxyribonuclease RuvC [Opitutales bacterium]
MGRATNRDLWTAKLTGRPAPAGSVSRTGIQSTGWDNAAATPGNAQPQGCILGIDPSLRGTGLAVVRFEGSLQGLLLHSQTLKLPPRLTRPECLAAIARTVAEVVRTHAVEIAAVEETIFVQNDRTAQILGAARGAAIAAAALEGAAVFEYAPKRIKQAVTGRGQASKEQVAKMIGGLLVDAQGLALDESDAAAVAFCHASMAGRPTL